MKIRVIITAIFAGMVSLGAFAAPIDVETAAFDEAPLFADAACDGLRCFDDEASKPSDFAVIFRAPADDMLAPLDASRIYYAPSSSPAWRAPMSEIKDVPEPGTLLLLGTALLLLASRQLAQRRKT